MTAVYRTTLAAGPEDLHAAQRLRYDVFARELGGDGPSIDHAAGLDRDRFDALCDHLLLIEGDSGAVVGTYRLLGAEGAAKAGGYYSEAEFDLGPLKARGLDMLEIGRSCLAADHRGGAAMLHLWAGVIAEIKRRGAEIVLGVGSFPGVEAAEIGPSVRLLEERFAAPDDWAPQVWADKALDLTGIGLPDDPVRAMARVPPLIKSYLKAGARVGQGAYLDTDLRTIDVCLVLETASATWPPVPEGAL